MNIVGGKQDLLCLLIKPLVQKFFHRITGDGIKKVITPY